MKFVIVALIMCVLFSGCFLKNYRNLCNTLYCKTDLTGERMSQVSDDYGQPATISIEDGVEIWTYDVSPMWQFGSKGKVVVFFDNGIVRESKFYPAQSNELPH